MWDLLVFAMAGLLTGAAARVFYQGRQPMRIAGTAVLGVAGALGGGMISWICWPAVDGEFHTGNLLLSIFGAMTMIVLWSCWAYARSLSKSRSTSP